MESDQERGSRTITTDLLHLIKWKDKYGKMDTIRLYEILSSVWQEISDLLQLNWFTRDAIETKNHGDPKKCIRDVMEKWLNEGKSLTTNYANTWNGLCSLLEDVRLCTVCGRLKDALKADISSFKNNKTSYDSESTEETLYLEKSPTSLISPYPLTGTQSKPHLRNFKFRGLELENLSKEERVKLQNTLQAQSIKISFKFASIIDSFCDYLETTSDIIPRIIAILQSFLEIRPLRKNDKNYSLQEALENVKTGSNISAILKKYCSFFNYHLVEHVFRHIKYEAGLEALKQHERILAEYAKKRICHFPSNVGTVGSSVVIVAVKLDELYENCLISHLLNYHERLCDLLKVNLGQFMLDGLKPGCICIIFHLLDHLLSAVFPLNEEKIQKLKELKCGDAKTMMLQCEKFSYDLTKDSTDPPVNFAHQLLFSTDVQVILLDQPASTTVTLHDQRFSSSLPVILPDQTASSTDLQVSLPHQSATSTYLTETSPNQFGSLKGYKETEYSVRNLKINRSFKRIIFIGLLVGLIAMLTPYYYAPTNSQTLHSKPKLEEMIYLEYSNGRNHLRIIEQITPHCKKLAYMLGLRHEFVMNMWDMTIPSTHTHTCRDTIRTWLEGQGHIPVTWETFIEALDNLQLRKLSDILRQIIREKQ